MPGIYDAEFYITGGSYVGLAPSPTVKDVWEPFVAHFTSTSAVATLYIIQESTTHNSIVRSLAVEEVRSYTFSCDESGWSTHNAAVKCSAFGGKDRAIEVAEAGSYTHAYQEIAVVAGGVYKVSGEFYPLAAGDCDGSLAVK
jgi:hypothetical protein